MKRNVKAARWTDQGSIEVAEIQVADPGPEQVQIAVEKAGICGSDLHLYRGDWSGRPGLVPGHEFGGIISAVGSGIDHVREGDFVGVEPILRCGRCSYCQTGNYHVCFERGLVGENIDGGMSELVNVPGNTVYKAPSGLDAELVALAEPLACGVHAYEKGKVHKDETVLVLGAGTIGLMALLAAKAIGARCLIIARHPHQQDAARRLGADEVIGDDEAGRARLAELSRQEAIDVAVESIGGHADNTILQAQRAVRRLGRVLVLGVATVPTSSIQGLYLVLKEVQIIGSMTYAAPNGRAEYDMALDMLADHADVARTLITHRLPLDDAKEGFDTALDKSTQSIKVVLNTRA